MGTWAPRPLLPGWPPWPDAVRRLGMSLPATVPAAEPLQQNAQQGLQLDARQRAMLAEMGVRLWCPQAVAAEPDALDADEEGAAADVAADAASAAPTLSAPAPARVPSHLPQQPAQAHVPHARHAPAAPARAASPSETQPQGQSPKQPQIQAQAYALPGGAFAPAAAAQASEGMRWLLVLDPPGLAEQAAGEPAAQADVRRLLLNMMAAVRLDAAQAYHLCAAQAVVAPGQMLDEAGLAPWRERLVQEIERLQPQLLLCLGRHAAYSVLGSQAPLGQLRGQAQRMVWLGADASAAAHHANLPVVVTYPPAYLLRTPAAKRLAWQDLCLAHALAQAALSTPSAESV